MNKIMQIYHKLLEMYGPQGWWPIVNDKTLICEYHPNNYSFPRTEEERFEVCIGAILAQNTGWYPNVVRAIQQLKLGRPFTKEELKLIEAAEIHKGIIREKPRKQTTGQILTQNTSWKNVVLALQNLKKIKSFTPKKILDMDIDTLKTAIRPAGYYNQKAKKIRIFTEFFISLKNAPVRDDLLSLWGIGPETADSILLYAYKKPEFVVDAYTRRMLLALGMIGKDADYYTIKSLFENSLPKDVELYKEFHALIVEHGKRHSKKDSDISAAFKYIKI